MKVESVNFSDDFSVFVYPFPNFKFNEVLTRRSELATGQN